MSDIMTIEVRGGEFDFYIEYPDDMSYALRVGWYNGVPYLYSSDFNFPMYYYVYAAIRHSFRDEWGRLCKY